MNLLNNIIMIITMVVLLLVTPAAGAPEATDSRQKIRDVVILLDERLVDIVGMSSNCRCYRTGHGGMCQHSVNEAPCEIAGGTGLGSPCADIGAPCTQITTGPSKHDTLEHKINSSASLDTTYCVKYVKDGECEQYPSGPMVGCRCSPGADGQERENGTRSEGTGDEC